MAEGQRVDNGRGQDLSLASVQQTDTGGVLRVRVGGVEYALGVSRVREVSRVGAIARVPRVPAGLRGVTAVRGEILPVLDLGERLAREPTDAGARKARLVTVSRSEEEGSLALLVDEVLGLVALRELGEGVRVLDLERVLDLDEASPER